MIKKYYVLFIIVFLLGATISYFIVDKLYSHSLTTKNNTIESRDNTITNKDNKISELKDSKERLEKQLKDEKAIVKSKEDKIGELEKQIFTLKDKNESLKTQLGQQRENQLVIVKLKENEIRKLQKQITVLKSEQKEKLPDWSSIIKKPIIGKIYQNERVELDGFSYIKCKFINVKFVYKGEAPFDMVDPVFVGTHGFDTTSSRPVSGMIKFLDAMGHLKNLKFNQVDPTKSE